MAIDLNVTPYYNDFTAAKKFNRVVFKPGVAVQARELTQLQDYFLNTLKEFGDFVFKDGATVRGGAGYPVLIPYIKVNDLDATSTAISNDTLVNYVGDTLTGGTTGIQAVIESVKTGTDTDAVEKKTFYLKYTKGNEKNAGTVASSVRFDAGETLTVTSDDSGRNGDTFVVDNNTDINSFTKNFYGYAIDFVLEEGIIYAQGKFVSHDAQKIRLDDFNPNVNYFVGVKINETIVNSDDDTSLLDPATGAYNYNAPGADRTKVDTSITKVPFGKNHALNTTYELGEFVSNGDNIYEVTTAGTTSASGDGPVHTTGNSTDGSVVFKYFEFPAGFTAIYKVNKGQIEKRYDGDLNELAELGKQFAAEKRESDGDYVVEPFTLDIQEHLKTVKGVSFDTSANVNYAQGQYVNHNNKLYEVVLSGTSAFSSPPTHTSGDVLSGTVKFGYRGASYRFDNQGTNFTTDDDAGDSTKLSVTVSPGVAYVNGFRREFYKNTALKIRKGTSTEIKEARDVTLGYGNYFNVKEVCGTFDIENGALCNIGYYGSFGSQTGAGAVTDGTFGGHAALGTKIGTCRVRAMKRASGNPGAAATQYRIFVYDVRINNGTLSDARTIQFPNSTDSGFADIILEDLNGNGTKDSAVLHGATYNKMVYNTPWNFTKTLAAAGGGSYDTQYYYTEEFNVSVAANGTFSLSTSSLGSEVIFPYANAGLTQTILDNRFYMVCKTSGITDFGDGTTVSGSEGRVIRLSPSQITAVANGQSMSFDMGAPSAGYDAYLQVEVKVVDAVPVPKAYNIGRYVTIDTNDNAGGSAGPWNLGITDVKEIEAIYIQPSSSNAYLDDSDGKVNYKDMFILDNGQRDNFYGHAKLIKKTGASVSTNAAYMTIKLSHFVANYGGSNGTYFAKDSYPVDDTGATGIYTFEIPNYTSPQLGTFLLKDAIDFRPMVKNTAVSATTLATATNNPYRTEEFDLPSNGIQFPTPNTSFTTDVEYYLPRVDNVVIDRAGTIQIVEGISKIPAKAPVDEADSMQIAEIFVAPFPSIPQDVANRFDAPESQVRHNLKGQNRRYTMQDIGQIEQRINRLEYYLALSLLEMQAKDQQILDANGNDRFKNGIYVNSFDDDSLSDLDDPNFSSSFDSSRKRLGPAFKDYQSDLILNETHGTSGWTRQGSLITRPFIQEVGTENRYATKVRNCVGELQFNYEGEMEIYPRSDNGANWTVPPKTQKIAISNKAAVDAEVAAFNSNDNVVGFETSFERGVFNAGNDTVAVGDSRTIQGQEVTISTDSEAGANVTGDVATNSGPTQLFNNILNTIFEQTGRTSVAGNVTGNVSGETSMTPTMQVQDIVQTSIPIIQTASASPSHKQEFKIEDMVTDVEFLPYMRQTRVAVRVRRLKPNTRLHFFFDGVNQSYRCCPCNVAKFDAHIPIWQQSGARTGHSFLETRLTNTPLGVEEDPDLNYTYSGAAPADMGAPIVTDQNGNAAFVYFLPAGNGGRDKEGEGFDNAQFLVGQRRMRVTDDITDRYNFVTTSAETDYSAYALHQKKKNIDITVEHHVMTTSTQPNVAAATKAVTGTHIVDVGIQPGKMEIEADLEANLDVTQPTFVVHPPRFAGDPIGQTFGIGDAPNGAFVKKISVFFRDRPGQSANTNNLATNTGQGITMQMRKVINGYPGQMVMGSKFLEASEVKTTPSLSITNGVDLGTNYDMSALYATDFEFDEPIYVAPNEEYAFVLLPSRNDPNYNIWVSKLGENKIGTTQRVTAEETNIAGMLFTSSNNRAWSAHQTEDIKYAVHYCQFTTGSGTVEFVNEDAEYITGSDYTAGRPQDGQNVHGFDVAVAGGGSGYSVNDIITLNSVNVTSTNNTIAGSGIKLKVTSVNSGAVTGAEVSDTGTGFQPIRSATASERAIVHPGSLGQLSVSPSGGSGATFTLKIKHGTVEQVDARTEKIEITYDSLSAEAALSDSSLYFKTGEIIGTGATELGELRKTEFKIASVYNKVFNNFRTNTTVKDFPRAKLTYGAAVTNSTGATAPNTSFVDIEPVDRTFTKEEAALYSASNEFGLTGSGRYGKKTYRQRFTLSTDTEDLSPVIPLYRNAVITRSYDINNDSTGETGNGGAAKSKFISRKVRLADGQEAEDVRLSVALKQPAGSSFKIYFKGQSPDDDGDFYEDLPWTEMELETGQVAGSSTSQSNFVDFNFKLPSTVLDGDGVFNYTTKRVDTLTIGTAGSGYTNTSSVDFIVTGGGTPTRPAAIKATALAGGGLGTIEIVDPGRGYSTAPTITVGRSHAVSTYYASGTFVGHGANLYEATVGGTTGAASASSAPTHTSSTATDGNVTWTYRGVRPVVTCSVANTTFERFKTFSSKIVMLTSNTSVIPEAKQLRIIALQA